MKKIALLLPLTLIIAACGGTQVSTYDLEINLPDQEARNDTVSIRVFTLITDGTSNCTALLEGEAAPGDSSYQIEELLSFDYPVSGKVAPLKSVGPGERLFFADAQDDSGAVILRGCSSVQAGRTGPQTVTINLQWLDACEITNGGIEICDNIDNNCNGQTDEGEGSVLCPALDHAAAAACEQGVCQYTCEEDWFNADNDWGNGCECIPTRGGEEWCDGLDNNCDGALDPAGCLECSSDADCHAANYCITGTCNGGTCTVEAIADNQACEDGDLCTEGDVCQDGVCEGQDKDCSDALDCTTDSCDVAGECQHALVSGYCQIDGECIDEGTTNEDDLCQFCDPASEGQDWSARDEGSDCDDGLWCTGTDTCSAAGECVHSDLPCTDVCNSGCDEEAQQCQPDQEGDSCDDGLSCTTNDLCDGLGACGSILNHNMCATGSECRPECAQDETGCVAPPTQIFVNCPESATLDGPAECVITVADDAGNEGCVTCEAQRLPMVLQRTDFQDDGGGSCNATDWTPESEDCRLLASGQTCPMSSGGSASPCCTELYCQGLYGLSLGQKSCVGNGWRLSQEIDLSNQGRADMCYDILRSSPITDSIQLEGVALDADGAGLVDFFCEDVAKYSHTHTTRVCQSLPSEAFSWGSSLLTLWAEAFTTASGSAYLNDLTVMAYPTGCLQNSPVFRTDFSGCGLMGSAQVEGWTSQSDPIYCAFGQTYCGMSEGMIIGENPLIQPQNQAAMDMYRDMNLTGLRAPGKLCFKLHVEPNAQGFLYVRLLSSQGSQEILNLDISEDQVDSCREYCLDLSQLEFQFFGESLARIEFEGDATNQFFVLNDIIFLATLPCGDGGEIVTAPVYDNGSGFVAPVTDEVGAPRRVLLNCTWGDSGISASDEFDFVAP